MWGTPSVIVQRVDKKVWHSGSVADCNPVGRRFAPRMLLLKLSCSVGLVRHLWKMSEKFDIYSKIFFRDVGNFFRHLCELVLRHQMRVSNYFVNSFYSAGSRQTEGMFLVRTVENYSTSPSECHLGPKKSLPHPPTHTALCTEQFRNQHRYVKCIWKWYDTPPIHKIPCIVWNFERWKSL